MGDCNAHRIFATTALFIGAAALAFSPANAQRKSDDVVAAGKKEGEVNVHGGPGRVFTQVHTEGFKKLYPEIKVNYTGLSGRDAIPKITREREAGLYNWDVYAGGTPSILQTLKPAGAFVPLRDDATQFERVFGKLVPPKRPGPAGAKTRPPLKRAKKAPI